MKKNMLHVVQFVMCHEKSIVNWHFTRGEKNDVAAANIT